MQADIWDMKSLVISHKKTLNNASKNYFFNSQVYQYTCTHDFYSCLPLQKNVFHAWLPVHLVSLKNELVEDNLLPTSKELPHNCRYLCLVQWSLNPLLRIQNNQLGWWISILSEHLRSHQHVHDTAHWWAWW